MTLSPYFFIPRLFHFCVKIYMCKSQSEGWLDLIYPTLCQYINSSPLLLRHILHFLLLFIGLIFESCSVSTSFQNLFLTISKNTLEILLSYVLFSFLAYFCKLKAIINIVFNHIRYCKTEIYTAK